MYMYVYSDIHVHVMYIHTVYILYIHVCTKLYTLCMSCTCGISIKISVY